MLKGGLIETADIIVVNKAELIGADIMAQNIQNYFGNIVYKTNSITGEGIAELVQAIKENRRR